jgi:hypothetical protein
MYIDCQKSFSFANTYCDVVHRTMALSSFNYQRVCKIQYNMLRTIQVSHLACANANAQQTFNIISLPSCIIHSFPTSPSTR